MKLSNKAITTIAFALMTLFAGGLLRRKPSAGELRPVAEAAVGSVDYGTYL